MARNERTWHPDFTNYMEMIVAHENYQGLPINRKADGSLSWVTTGNSELGINRKVWAENKARHFGFQIRPGVYAEVMREIHPTKIHICQICGSQMSIYYLYPSTNFLKAIQREFTIEFSDCDHISDVWDTLIEDGNTEKRVTQFFRERFALANSVLNAKEAILKACEHSCRIGGKRLLSPGAMSDFPDRFDGFHTYNRCCRAMQDMGRSKENLKSYTKDRRAFEYWSDGNIHAANMFMGSTFFESTSADHIGAISLGFVHDPRYLRPMSGGENSTKRDRLVIEDIEEILRTESRTGVYPMSWYSSMIWDHIKSKFRINPELVSIRYREMLKHNMANFMYILFCILDKCGEYGQEFLLKTLIEPKYEYFMHTYEFNAIGDIIKQTPRHFTERSRNEIERFTRIAFDSVFDYNDKSNRHVSPDLTSNELNQLNTICMLINGDRSKYPSILKALQSLISIIQCRIITH